MFEGVPRGLSRNVAVRLCGLAALLLLSASALAGEARADSRLFEPVISLTGGCGTTKLDPVKDPWCPGPPAPSPFKSPSITIDSFGDMYVASHQEGPGGYVSVFSPEGKFLTEIPASGAKSLAVDKQGNLYVFQFVSSATEPVEQVTLFTPSVYKPAEDEIDYELPGTPVIEEGLWSYTALAVDPATGRLFVSSSTAVQEWSSASAGTELLDGTIGHGVLTQFSAYLAIDSSRNRLYVADSKEESEASTVEVFELNSPHNYLGMLNGDATPEGKFLSNVGLVTLDVDEQTGNLFVSDLAGKARNWNVYEMGLGLGEDEELLNTYQHSFEYVEPGEIAVDNAPLSPNYGTLYVPSSGEAVYHIYAFKESSVEAPKVEGIFASGVTETEALLEAIVNPGGGATEYRFKYTTASRYEEEGFAGAFTVGTGTLPAGIVPQNVAIPLTGLQPGTPYRFRVEVSNQVGEAEAEASFRTYPSATALSCPNEAFRIGPSADLPDCRAYELVTPPDTNGRSPKGVGSAGGTFPTLQASSDGKKVSFRTEGGSLPGSEGSGAFNGEWYLSTRDENTGWSTKIAAPSGTEAVAPSPGSVSPDQEYSFWEGRYEGESASFVRYPDGHSELVGRGSLGINPNLQPNLITVNGGHIIFTTQKITAAEPQQLEENAPPEGTGAVYDRTSDEVTHVVSLLPGGITPAAGENALYVGASPDGRGIAFTIGGTLYLRRDNTETYEIGNGVTFAGIAEGGGRIFYVESGNLLARDVADGEAINFTESGNAVPVNIASDGTKAYFLSTSVLTKEENPNGQIAKKGQQNLYLSEEGEISFVGTVLPADVSQVLGGGDTVGLGQWIESLELGKPGDDTSRTTPNGSVLLFESRAALAEYDPEGHVEIYRFDSAAGTLTCLSCNPTEAPASSDASLQSVQTFSGVTQFMSTHALVPNLRPDGKRAFFQSSEALVPKDVDGLLDVYEWEAPGVGSCQRVGGCVYLISSGQSNHDDRLYAASENGDDVFFLSSDILVGSDQEEVPSIYDARVGGGFPESVPNTCQGEGCRPALTEAPTLTAPATAGSGQTDNVKTRRCPKGKHKVKRHGRTRCVKKRPHHRHAKSSKKGGSK